MCVNEDHSIDNLTITRAIGLQLTKKRLITMKRYPGDDDGWQVERIKNERQVKNLIKKSIAFNQIKEL